MGHLFCLDADTESTLVEGPGQGIQDAMLDTWGFAGHPLLDGDRLICLVGGKGSVAVAFNKDTGKEIWKALSAREPGYAPPMIYRDRRQTPAHHLAPDSINALDPETGKAYWSQQYGDKKFVGAGMTIPTPRLDSDKLFFSAFYAGSLMLKLTAPTSPRSHGRAGPRRTARSDGACTAS